MAADARPDPTISRRDGLVVAGIAAIVLATVLAGVLAPATLALAPGDDAACAEWGDGCRVCQRVATGPACSTPGIACVPAQMRCLRRAGG